MLERCERANERTDKRVAQYLRLDSLLFQTTVHRRRVGTTAWVCVFELEIKSTRTTSLFLSVSTVVAMTKGTMGVILGDRDDCR